MSDQAQEQHGQWFSNKELFQMQLETQRQMAALNTELQRTTELVKRYNGLREKVDGLEDTVNTMRDQAAGRGRAALSMREWATLLVALGSLVVAAIALFGGAGH